MKLLHQRIASMAVVLCTMTAAADPIMEVTCQQCRGTDHSLDFGNYAFNQTYGPGSTLFEDELIVFNADGGWAHVDLNFVLEENIISTLGDFIGIDLGLPTREIQIDITTDTTETSSYRIDLDMIDATGPLPVGENNDTDPGDSDSGGGIGGGGDSGGSTGGVGAGGAGSGSTGGEGDGGGGGGNACTSAGDGEWYCVAY